MPKNNWDIVLTPNKKLFDVNLGDLWRYRNLIGIFVKRDFVAHYKQTILGPLWYVINPLVTTMVFTIIFGRVAKISTDGTPPFIFYMAGTVCWSYFSLCLKNTSNIFVKNSSLFGKVFFPRLTVPIAVILIPSLSKISGCFFNTSISSTIHILFPHHQRRAPEATQRAR